MPPASKKGEKRAGKAKTKAAGPKPKQKESLSIYIYEVLKQVHPDTGISSEAMLIVNWLTYDVFSVIAGEASKLAQYNSKATISSREVQTAVRLLLPGDLAKFAVAMGTMAVSMCNSIRALHRSPASKT